MKIWISEGNRAINYESVFNYFKDAEFALFEDETFFKKNYADIFLTSDEYNYHSTSRLLSAKSLGIPTLHIVDGICEWRNTWENPRSLDQSVGMPLFQPLLADKVVCLGPAQARLFESWGSHGKCEVAGLPRFDATLLEAKNRKFQNTPYATNGLITIATARTAGFTPAQQKLAEKCLFDINHWFETKHPELMRYVVWRPGNKDYLPMNPVGRVSDASHEALLDILKGSRVFITTPSTAALEAMLLGIPTCVADYTNSPRFLNSAWFISAENHLDQELTALLSPTAQRLQFQQHLLHDQVRCDSLAAPRVAQLIEEMVAHARFLRARNSELNLPPSMVPALQEFEEFSYPYRPELLFPAHPVFCRTDLPAIQAENGHLHLKISALEAELRRRSMARHITDFLKRLVHFAARRLRAMKNRFSGDIQ